VDNRKSHQRDTGLMKLSIIIPTLDEAETLEKTLRPLAETSHEVIVVDGGSADGTRDVASARTHRVISSPPGRGRQQDVGAGAAGGNVLLFLHADTLLPPGFDGMILGALEDPGVIMGAFRLRIHPATAWLRLVAHMANLRSRFLKLPYGDQGLFLRRTDYFRAGGFPPWPIMEDVALVGRLNRLGRFRLLDGVVRTSARRWEKEGPLRATLRDWSLILRYRLGDSPRALARHYRHVR